MHDINQLNVYNAHIPWSQQLKQPSSGFSHIINSLHFRLKVLNISILDLYIFLNIHHMY